MTTDPTADPPPAPPRRRTFTERLGKRPGTRGFVERLKADSSADIYLIRGNDSTGRPAWYYLRAHRGKKVAFETASKRGNVQLTEYGTIILSGYGKTPPPDVVARMSAEYGFNEGTSATESDD
jgi:hypothetical protein